VGGKGGVGKTTVSGALAVQLTASNPDLKVLVVSTDPAHSLGDALDVDLRHCQGKIVPLTDPLTQGRLFAQEVDAAAALQEFRTSLEAAFDVPRLAEALQVSPELLDSLGLSEFSGLLQNPPPGLDELVALSNVFDPMSSNSNNHFDVVVVDTAPTGHTLRLLQLPQFLDGLLGKLIQLRLKLAGLASTLQAFLGGEQAQQRQQAIDNAMDRLEKFRRKMSRLRSHLQDAKQTKFVVVTVPTILGVAETERLVQELTSQGVSVTDIVVNQCVGVVTTTTNTPNDNDNAAEAMLRKYYERRCAGQQKWIGKLRETVNKVSNSNEYQENGSAAPIAITTVPFFDVELVGVPALGYVGSQIYPSQESFRYLLLTEDRSNDAPSPPRVVICGGKGGVGKTTTSSSLAVTMAAAGHKVALISTDPAHSLGDAVAMNLKGGKMQDCSIVGVPNNTGEGSLSVLEIDPAESLKQFKGVVDQLMGDTSTGGGSSDDSDNSSSKGLREMLKDLQQVFDTLPAGTDEVVALANIVNLVKKGGFDRIVLDTAPTGHTLRMLSTPGFLAELIDRLLSISDKINSNAAVKLFINSSRRRDEINAAIESSKSTLYKFQFQMYDLEDLFTDAERTEFLIVTIATELAVRESVRLLNDLTFEAPDMPIKVRNVIVNQVLDSSAEAEDGARVFLSHLEASQKKAISDLERFAVSASCTPSPPIITKIPYLDTEPRGVFGLKILANELLKEAGEMVEEFKTPA
jgi:arsenite-transporting ATPase